MDRLHRVGLGASVATLVAVLGATQASAQVESQQAARAEDAATDEIIVTAQKRSQALQDVPMSITAFSGESLERAGITEFRDYAVRVPNLAFSYSNSLSAGSQAIAIRGVFGANTTGVYLDEVPLQASVDPRVADIERIEVLRGPQGTLYGARSMGGTIRLITRQPDVTEFSGHAHTVGSHTEEGDWNGSADFGVNIPLVEDVFAIRANLFADHQSGVFDRVASVDAPVAFDRNENVDSSRRIGGQLAARLELLDGNLVITPRAAFEQADTFGRSYADAAPGNFVHSRLFDVDERGSSDWQLYSLTAQYDTDFGSFVSSTSQFNRDYDDSEDFAEFASLAFGVPPSLSVIRANVEFEAFAQEFRFASDFDGPFQFTAGAFLQHTDNVLVFPPTAVGAIFDNIFSQTLETQVDETAFFGEGTYSITDRLRITIGARWFDNQVDFVGEQDGIAVSPDSFAGVQTETGVNPKYQIEYDATDDFLIYAAASEGFRIGGVNSFSNLLCGPDLATLGLNAADVLTFDSDSLWSYEAGAKTTWLDRRLTANVAAYNVEWEGLQQLVPLPTCGFNLQLNAGTAQIRGFEMEFILRATDDLALNFGVGYADSEITGAGAFGASIPVGVPVQQVPLWTFNAGLDYDFEIAAQPAFLHLDYAFVDESFSANNDAANLSDVPPLAIELPGRPRIATNRPRTIGVEARLAF